MTIKPSPTLAHVIMSACKLHFDAMTHDENACLALLDLMIYATKAKNGNPYNAIRVIVDSALAAGIDRARHPAERYMYLQIAGCFEDIAGHLAREGVDAPQGS